MDDLQLKVNNLAKNHPLLSRGGVEHTMPRLKRMQAFYEEKAPGAPEGQARMFNGFVSALDYAMKVIEQYDDLTGRIAKLNTEADDGLETPKTDSGI